MIVTYTYIYMCVCVISNYSFTKINIDHLLSTIFIISKNPHGTKNLKKKKNK